MTFFQGVVSGWNYFWRGASGAVISLNASIHYATVRSNRWREQIKCRHYSGLFPTKDMQSPLPPLSFSPIFMMDAQIFRFIFFELWLIVFTIYWRHNGIFKCVTNQKKSSISGQIYRKDAQWMKNQFCDFYFLRYGRFCTQNSSNNWPILFTKTTISVKLKIGKLIFRSFQHIPHLSCKYDHFWFFFCQKTIWSI